MVFLLLVIQQVPHFSPHSKAKANYKKANISGRMAIIGVSDAVSASVFSEKTRLKKCWIMIIIIMKKSQEMTFFHGCQKLTSAMKQRPANLMLYTAKSS